MSGYDIMNEKLIVDYVKSLELNIFEKNSKLEAKEIGDGNLNYVFRVKDIDTGKSIIVKQALPYLKVAGEDWRLTIDRNRIEAEAMKEQNIACEGMVPKIYYSSKEKALYIAEDLGYMDTLRNRYMSMKKYYNFPRKIGKFLARNLYYTSDFGIGPIEKKIKCKEFINPELCDITERLVLTDPYRESPSNDINPEILDEVKKMWNRNDVCLEIAKLKDIFLTKCEALLHGDLHTGSIFIDENNIKVFDAEFAFYGPYGYDIGLLIANLILNYCSYEGLNEPKDKVENFREYLLDTIEKIWNCFEEEFRDLWKESEEKITKVEGYYNYYINNLLNETIGFCSCEIIRRVVGMAHVPDLDRIKDNKERAKAQLLALKIAQLILIERKNIQVIEELVEIIRTI